MKRRARALLFTLATLVGGAAVLPVQAGTFEFIDRMFTFRESQKERVAPKRRLPPKLVYEPYYDEPAAQNWSQFYTQPTLEPQPYLDGSASKVMRAPGGALPATTWQVADPAGRYSGPAAPDYDTAATYGHAGGDIFIGEPGESPRMALADGNVGRGIEIGEPVRDWRERTPPPIPSRPGDFDVRLTPAPEAQTRPDADLANRARERADFANATDGTAPSQYANDPRYLKFNADGQVTRYAVQPGDTLGGIAGQEAIYQNWKLWPLIYSANRRAIGRNPNAIRPSQELSIPRGYTDAQARDAMRRAVR